MTITEILRQIEQLKYKVRCLSCADATSYQTQINNINIALTNLTNRVGTAEADIVLVEADITAIELLIANIQANYQLRSEKGQPNGYASLDSNGFVPATQISGVVINDNVANYSALPAANMATGQTYGVLNSQGTSWLPGPIGGTYYSKGFYYSNGTDWSFMGSSPYQATQAEVNAGVNTQNFITPATLAASSLQADLIALAIVL